MHLTPSPLLARFSIWTTAILLIVTSASWFPSTTHAASLTSVSDTLSSAVANDTGVTHTIGFTIATSDLIKQISIRFSTTNGGGTKPAGLDLTSATSGTITGLGSGWSFDTSVASSGIIKLTRASAVALDSTNVAVVPIQGVTNSAIDDCQATDDTLTDTCHVRVTTYTDDGTNAIDLGDTTYTTEEDPQISFEVEDVPSGETHNGITTNISTSSNSIAFGHVPRGTVRYGAHKITFSTNAPHGYSLYVRLVDQLTGSGNTSNEIDPFGAVNATWITPQAWTTPSGTARNVNSGWIGANTSDTTVAGWASGSSLFGPLNTSEHAVSTGSGPQRTAKVIYVTYAIQINGYQSGDAYRANLIYDARPRF